MPTENSQQVEAPPLPATERYDASPTMPGRHWVLWTRFSKQIGQLRVPRQARIVVRAPLICAGLARSRLTLSAAFPIWPGVPGRYPAWSDRNPCPPAKPVTLVRITTVGSCSPAAGDSETAVQARCLTVNGTHFSYAHFTTVSLGLTDLFTSFLPGVAKVHNTCI